VVDDIHRRHPVLRPPVVPGTVSEGLNGWSEALTV